MLPPAEPLSGARSVQLRDAERLRLPPCDGERNSGVDRGKRVRAHSHTHTDTKSRARHTMRTDTHTHTQS